MFPDVIAGSLATRSTTQAPPGRSIKAPHYLTAHYWWAYVHPRAIWLFERQWLVNLILWGNYAKLRNSATAALGNVLPGATLQVACVYGDLTGKLSQRVAAVDGRLDVVDVLPMQLQNTAVRRPRPIVGYGFRRSQSSGCQLRSGAAIFSVARAAQPASRADL